MLAYMHQTTWVGKVEGGLGRASCRRAGGDGWCFVRAVGCLWAPFMRVATGELLMLAYMHQTTWVGKVEEGLGRASCRLMRRAVRQTRVATWREAPEHQARATRANMLLCARWEATDLFLLLRNFCQLTTKFLSEAAQNDGGGGQWGEKDQVAADAGLKPQVTVWHLPLRPGRRQWLARSRKYELRTCLAAGVIAP